MVGEHRPDAESSLAALTRTHFLGYGLGWDLQDEFGFKRVSHTGGVPEPLPWVSMIPELQLGVLVFTNQESGAAMEAVGNQILDAYVAGPNAIGSRWQRPIRRDARAKRLRSRRKRRASRRAQVRPHWGLEAYLGEYSDAWRGAATVRRDGDHLVLTFSRTRGLEGALTPYNGNIFIVRWNNRKLNADAYVRFMQGYDGKVQGMTMKAVSPATDFSFDFQDLDFKKVVTPDPTHGSAK